MSELRATMDRVKELATEDERQAIDGLVSTIEHCEGIESFESNHRKICACWGLAQLVESLLSDGV